MPQYGKFHFRSIGKDHLLIVNILKKVRVIWKLPAIEELRSMVDEDFAQPMVDTTFFPDFPPTQIFYSSSTEHDKNKRQAKVLIFNCGSDDDMFKHEKYYVRCVRAEK